MTRGRCPRCGGRTEIESESWHRGDRRVVRTHGCVSCGSRFETSVDWPDDEVLWVLLRTLPFGERAALYGAITSAVEGFLKPVWMAALAVAAVLLAAASLRRPRRRADALPATLAPDVHLRAEPEGKLTIVVSDTRAAAVRDFVVDRVPEEEERLLSEFADLARRSVSFGEDRGAKAGTLHAGREEIDASRRAVYSLGLAIGERLLGPAPDARARIADLHGDHLLLRVQPELLGIPWELLVPRRGGQFLWQLFDVSRQIRGCEGAPRSPRRAEGPLRVLLLANLEAGREGRDLPDAEREAALLLDLAAARPDVFRVERKSPASARELGLLIGQGYDVVHFAGHSSREGGEAAWVLGNGEPAGPIDQALGEGSPPVLVFANACSSGPERVWGGGESPARRFLEAGVAAYVGTNWDLHDAGSAAFADAFYRALVGGSTLAQAVSAARSALFGAHPLAWANYVLYGDPTLRLVPGRPR